jgi:hypothetical protein
VKAKKQKRLSATPRRPAKSAKRTADAYRRGLLASGEAAPAQDGVLPPGATHEVVDEGGERKLVRRRFSIA